MSQHAGMPVIKGEKYAFNLWFKECRAKKLYSEFNPGYYKSISITTTNTIIPTINTSETIYDVKTNKRSTIINEKYKLEEGDYFPFINLHFHSGHLHLHNFVDDKEFMIIVLKNIEQITHFNRDIRYNTIILYKEGTPIDNIKSICCNTSLIYNLFEDCNEKYTYIY